MSPGARVCIAPGVCRQIFTDELAKHSVRFMQRHLSSDSYAVRFIANYGVYVGVCFHVLGIMHFSVVLVMGSQQVI